MEESCSKAFGVEASPEEYFRRHLCEGYARGMFGPLPREESRQNRGLVVEDSSELYMLWEKGEGGKKSAGIAHTLLVLDRLGACALVCMPEACGDFGCLQTLKSPKSIPLKKTNTKKQTTPP